MASKDPSVRGRQQRSPLLRELLNPGSSKMTKRTEGDEKRSAEKNPLGMENMKLSQFMYLTPAQQVLWEQLSQKNQRLRGLLEQQNKDLQLVTEQLTFVMPKRFKLDNSTPSNDNTVNKSMDHTPSPPPVSANPEVHKPKLQPPTKDISQFQGNITANILKPQSLSSANERAIPLEESSQHPLKNSAEVSQSPLSASIDGLLEAGENRPPSSNSASSVGSFQSPLQSPVAIAQHSHLSPMNPLAAISTSQTEHVIAQPPVASLAPNTAAPDASVACSKAPANDILDMLQFSRQPFAADLFDNFESGQQPSQFCEDGNQQQNTGQHLAFMLQDIGDVKVQQQSFPQTSTYANLVTHQKPFQQTETKKRTPQTVLNTPVQPRGHLNPYTDATRTIDTLANDASLMQGLSSSGSFPPTLQPKTPTLTPLGSSLNGFSPQAGNDLRLSEQLLRIQLIQHQMLLRQQANAYHSLHNWSVNDNFLDDPWMSESFRILSADSGADVTEPHSDRSGNSTDRDLMSLHDFVMNCSVSAQSETE